ncbi:MAG TPA: MFS transporter, partial [Gemmatimonadaceae bacterium]|nr:MFS transporter [Gemmatimonadaceae bacterium]
MRIRGITRNVVVLGWVSFLTDVASEMLYPVMPLFLVGTLGASPALLGVIDGIAEGVSSGLRWIAGALSDRYRRRQPFVVAGYALSAVSKPVMGLASVAVGWPLFLLGRCSDRLGKSIRTSARDALIADSTEPQYRGVAFGFHRALDTLGAVVGPLVALLVVTIRPGTSLTWLFLVAFVPGLLSAGLALVAVRDVPHEPGRAAPPSILQRFPRAFWTLIAANALFSLGNSSDAFLILRSTELGLTLARVICAYALYNAVYALGAIPLGRLSDRIGRKPVLIGGWCTYAVVYLAFARANVAWAPWVLLPVYGLYQAFSDGVSKAMVSDVVPTQQRAGAIGLFYTVSGLGQLIASVVTGALWGLRLADGRVMVVFAISGVCALAAVPV